jgi:hypothetical protein
MHSLNYSQLEIILNKNSPIKNNPSLKYKSFNIGLIEGNLEREKDLEIKKKLFDCNFRINDAFDNIMSSNISVDSEEDSNKDDNFQKSKLLSLKKKKNNPHYFKKKKIIFDSKKDLMDFGLDSKIKRKIIINLNQNNQNNNNLNINNSKLSILAADEIKKKLNDDYNNNNENNFKNLGSNLNIHLSENKNENKENDYIFKDGKNIFNVESTKSDFYRKIRPNDKIQNKIFAKTTTSFFPKDENNIFPERIISNKNKTFDKENFKKINDLKNKINNAFSKNFDYSRPSTKSQIKTNFYSEFSKIYNEKFLITNKNLFSKFPTLSRTNNTKTHKNSNHNNSRKNEKNEDESDILSLNFNYKQDKDCLVNSIKADNNEKESGIKCVNNKIYSTKISDKEKENNIKFSSEKNYIQYEESESDTEYNKELIKNHRNLIKKRKTIKNLISNPETFDGILYKNKDKINKIEKKNYKNLNIKYSNNIITTFKNKNNADNINYNNNPRSNYNSKKSLFEHTQKNTPKVKDEKIHVDNSYDNSNSKSKIKKDINNELYENRDMYIKENINVNSSDLSNSEFNRKTQLLIDKNKIANRNIMGSKNSNKTSSYISFKIPSVRDLNYRNSKEKSHNDFINFKENEYIKKTKLDGIQEKINLNKNFSEDEQIKLKYIREKLVTPSKNINENKYDINPYNFIRSISNIQNKTKNIAKLYNKKIKNYKNPVNIVKNVEDEHDIYLKIPKKSKLLRNKVVMVSSCVEEHRKNYTNLSENKRQLLEIVDFINAMNDEKALNLKENLLLLYKNSEKKNGLIELPELMKEKMKLIFKGENNLNDIILKNKQMKNDLLITRREIKNKYFKNDKKNKPKNK